MALSDWFKEGDRENTLAANIRTDTEFAAHLARDRYGDFLLTQAIRPDPDLQPIEGYRYGAYAYPTMSVPTIVAAASREKLAELFLELTALVAPDVDVYVDMTHNYPPTEKYRREGIDNVVFQSMVHDYSDIILDDGFLGIAVGGGDGEELCEVGLDEHKLLFIYGHQLQRFDRILREFGIAHKQDMKFIMDAPHLHRSSDGFFQKALELVEALDAEKNWNNGKGITKNNEEEEYDDDVW